MFGFGETRRLRAQVDNLKTELKRSVDALVACRRASVVMDGELRNAAAERSAADLQLSAERQDNESLRARLKTTQAGLDHATRCYERSEADRNATASERDEILRRVVLCDLGVEKAKEERDAALKERDEWREAAESAVASNARISAACRRFAADLSQLTEPANASDPDPAPEGDPELGADPDPAPFLGPDGTIIFHDGASCHVSREDGRVVGDGPDLGPDGEPDFIRFPRPDDPGAA